jgi:hypothetical protein
MEGTFEDIVTVDSALLQALEILMHGDFGHKRCEVTTERGCFLIGDGVFLFF